MTADPSPPSRLLAEWTTDQARAAIERRPTAVLLPLGSVEPHGPHLPLRTDSLIGETAAARAALVLCDQGVTVAIAPTIAYGVTDFAAGFSGAISVPPAVLTAFVHAVVSGYLQDGWMHVCLVNNHLEPAHDAAVRAAAAGFPAGAASVACPLTRRWGRTLSDEFKRGNCHAGRYETSLVLAAGWAPSFDYKSLPPIDTSLSDAIRAGQSRFVEMGLSRAYTGAPAEGSAAEGDALYDRLVAMIVAEVGEGLQAKAPPPETG
jgi:creatinine amidohydrolase